MGLSDRGGLGRVGEFVVFGWCPRLTKQFLVPAGLVGEGWRMTRVGRSFLCFTPPTRGAAAADGCQMILPQKKSPKKTFLSTIKSLITLPISS